MVNYPPYVNPYGKISELFKRIKEAAVPPKFTNDFLYSKLGLKSTTNRAFIPLLKRLGFINENQVPTSMYRDYREDSKSKIIMAKAIKEAYKDLYSAAEYAHTLSKEEIKTKLISVLGASKDDNQIPKVVATFLELKKLADFESEKPVETEENSKEEEKPSTSFKEVPQLQIPSSKLGISYTINLNLPATNDVEVFNAIFKALKENLLK
jgi:hypothetical protein